MKRRKRIMPAAVIRLGRLNLAPLTMSVPVLGALTAPNPPALSGLGLLALIGLGAHLFGFAVNDLFDQALDQRHPDRAWSPLVSGALSRRQAWLAALLPLPLVFGLYAWAFPAAPAGLVLLLLSLGLSLIYNRWSKWGRPALAEAALALSIGLLCLAGALTAVPPSLSLSVSLSLSLILYLLNSVPSGLKDIDHDAAGGGQSFVLAAGCQVDAAGRLVVSPRLWRYTLLLQCLIWLSLGVVAWGQRPAGALLGLSALLALYGGLHLRLLLTRPTVAALRRLGPLRSGYYNYLALLLLLAPALPASLLVLVVAMGLALLLAPWWRSYLLWRRPSLAG